MSYSVARLPSFPAPGVALSHNKVKDSKGVFCRHKPKPKSDSSTPTSTNTPSMAKDWVRNVWHQVALEYPRPIPPPQEIEQALPAPAKTKSPTKGQSSPRTPRHAKHHLHPTRDVDGYEADGEVTPGLKPKDESMDVEEEDEVEAVMWARGHSKSVCV